MKLKQIFLLALVYLHGVVPSRAADDRILIEGKINNQPVRFAFDTGTGAQVLFRPAAERLGLRITNAPADFHPQPGEVPMGITEECSFTFVGDTNVIRCAFGTVDVPDYTFKDGQIDGALGWRGFDIKFMEFIGTPQRVDFTETLSKEAAKWTRVRIATNISLLCLEIPTGKGKQVRVALDTGAANGIMLSPKLWNEWRAAHTNQPATMCVYWTPAAGLVIAEESWAKTYSFGNIVFNDVPIMANGITVDTFDVMLGLAAMRHLDFVIDLKQNYAYVRTKTSAVPYQHNRLGAVFAPKNLESDDRIAHVVPGSPAYKVGIRNGDLLLKVDGRDATKWRTEPEDPNALGPWERPAGTKTKITYKRNGEVFETEAVLQDILPPKTKNR